MSKVETDFYDSILERSHTAFESKFYLESISLSYAFLENRLQRLLHNLNNDFTTTSLSMDRKLEKLNSYFDADRFAEIIGTHNQLKDIDEKSREKLRRKIIFELNNRNVDGDSISLLSDGHDYKKGRLSLWAKKRNKIMHNLSYVEQGQPTIDWEIFTEVASEGITLSKNISKAARNIKQKLR